MSLHLRLTYMHVAKLFYGILGISPSGEMADAHVSGACGAIRGGSSPLSGTIGDITNKYLITKFYLFGLKLII